jgi:hypothetical protein
MIKAAGPRLTSVLRRRWGEHSFEV